MPIFIWIWNNKRWTIIIVLSILLFWQTWLSNKYAAEISKSDQKCTKKVDSAIKPYQDAEKIAQDNANKLSENYEQQQAKEKTKTETIERTMQKIIERPIYITSCFDDAGVSVVNQAAGFEHSSEPETTMP
ncbi:MAG: hypothetical protein RR633_16600 [Acinetobacter sp.]